MVMDLLTGGGQMSVVGCRGRSGAIGNITANATTRPGSIPGDPEGALASGRSPASRCDGSSGKYVEGHWMNKGATG
jgi:hypothetical protein